MLRRASTPTSTRLPTSGSVGARFTPAAPAGQSARPRCSPARRRARAGRVALAFAGPSGALLAQLTSCRPPGLLPLLPSCCSRSRALDDRGDLRLARARRPPAEILRGGTCPPLLGATQRAYPRGAPLDASRHRRAVALAARRRSPRGRHDHRLRRRVTLLARALLAAGAPSGRPRTVGKRYQLTVHQPFAVGAVGRSPASPTVRRPGRVADSFRLGEPRGARSPAPPLRGAAARRGLGCGATRGRGRCRARRRSRAAPGAVRRAGRGRAARGSASVGVVRALERDGRIAYGRPPLRARLPRAGSTISVRLSPCPPRGGRADLERSARPQPVARYDPAPPLSSCCDVLRGSVGRLVAVRADPGARL